MEHKKMNHCNACKKQTIHLFKDKIAICQRCRNIQNIPGISIKEYTLWLAREKLNYDLSEKEADNLMMSFGFEYNHKAEMTK